jgi:hypothetical protein
VKKKQTKTQRINALLASRPELTPLEVAERLKVSPNLVHQVRWKTKKNAEFVNKVFTKAGLKKQSKVIEAVKETKAAMDALEKPKRKRRITRKRLLKELQPGLDALFGLQYKKTVNFAQQKDGTIIDLDEGGKVNSSPDLVNKPPHYTAGGIDFIDFAEAKGLTENAYLFNVVKYVTRTGKKEGVDPVQDLEKAEFYLKREIARRKRA